MIENNDMSIKIFDLCLFSKDKQTLLNAISSHFDNSSKISYIFTPNPEQVIQSHQDTSQSRLFLEDLQSADWLIPDGVGLVWASKLLHSRGQVETPLKQRIAGADLVIDVLNLVSKRSQDHAVLIIGGDGYESSAISKLEQQTKLKIHWTPGYVNASQPTAQEETAVLKLIQEVRPSVVFVALGAPTQERWLIEHRSMLESANVGLGMAVGGRFDYIIVTVSRAPVIVRQ